MGLDATISEVCLQAVVDDFNYRRSRFYNVFEIIYWRGNRLLHEWMERRYQSQGGRGSFNGIPLRLRKQCLIEMINDASRSGRFKKMIPRVHIRIIEQQCVYRVDECEGAFYYEASY